MECKSSITAEHFSVFRAKSADVSTTGNVSLDDNRLSSHQLEQVRLLDVERMFDKLAWEYTRQPGMHVHGK